MRIRQVPVLMVVMAVLLGVVTPAAPAAATTSHDEAWFVAQINHVRQSAGLEPLSLDPELTTEARDWARVMAIDGQLKHASDLSVGIDTVWDVLGENVGVHHVGRDEYLAELFEAFVSSPSHYANLIDPRFEHVGVGVIHDSNGRIWTAHRFMSVPAPAEATASRGAASTAGTPPPGRLDGGLEAQFLREQAATS